VNELETQHNRKVKRLRSDRGTEYDSDSFNDFYKSHRIIHEKTAPYSPEMSGKVKRKNRTLNELVVVVLLNSEATSY